MQSCAKNNHESVPLSLTGIFASLLHNLCCLSLNISQTERDAEIFFFKVFIAVPFSQFSKDWDQKREHWVCCFPCLEGAL